VIRGRTKLPAETAGHPLAASGSPSADFGPSLGPLHFQAQA
jgi:hypothetical protein